MNAEMLIQQVPPADVVRALRTFVGRASRTVELSMINVLALVVTDVRTRGATESFSGTLLFRNIILFNAGRKLAGSVQFQVVHSVKNEMLGQFLFIGHEKWADGALDGSTRSAFMMLPMQFNVCQTFRDERANGTRILLHVRMHDVTHGIFFGQRTLSLDRFLLLFAIQQRHGQIVSFAAQFRPVFVRHSILNHLNIAIMFQTAMALNHMFPIGNLIANSTPESRRCRSRRRRTSSDRD